MNDLNAPTQRTTSYGYHAAGNLLYYYDGRGDATQGTAQFEYDELDHLKARMDGAGNQTKFEFDGEGLLSKRTGAKGAGYETSYQYNARRSLTEVNAGNELK